MNKFSLRVRRIALSVTLAVGLGCAIAPASNAATPTCASGYTCLWQDKDYWTGWAPGYSIKFQYGIPYLSQYKYYSVGNGDNSASSVFNAGTQMTVTLYDGANYVGSRLKVLKGKGYTDLSKVKADGVYWDNRISSGRYV